MAQTKYTVQVTNGSQTVKVAGSNVASFIKAGQVFMVVGEHIPYFVAADATFNGTDTLFGLTGNYLGATNTAAPGVIATGKTPVKGIHTLSQGDVGTAAIFTLAMYRLEELLGSVSDGTLDGKTSDALAEGIANLFFTPTRVRTTPLTGLAAANQVVAPTDTVLTSVGKLQGQHSAHVGSRGDQHAVATQFEHGFLSAPDKQKLDALAPPVLAATAPVNPANLMRWTNSANSVTYTWITSANAWVQVL